MATPVIKRIQEHHKSDELYLLTTPSYLDFFSNWENLLLKPMARSGLFDIAKQIRWIRKHKFDRIYDLQSNDRTTLLCALSEASYRAGNHPRYPYNVHPPNPYYGQCHSFDRLNEILKSAGIPEAKKQPFLYISGEIHNKVIEWLNYNNLKDEKFILIHAGSSFLHKQKRWPFFDKLACGLSAVGFKIIWIGATDDIDLNKSLSNQIGINATSQFSIQELVELGKHAKFAITNDSAPMHILSCSGIPVYGLFGPTNPRRTHALGQEHRVIFAGGKLPDNDMAFEPVNIACITVEAIINRLKTDGLLD